jgi:hypothetical protein
MARVAALARVIEYEGVAETDRTVALFDQELAT